MAFELCYLRDMPGILRTLASYDYNIKALIEKVRGGKKVSGGDMHNLMVLAMAASYDPAVDEPCGIRLPVTLDTCEIIPDRWQNWLDRDPVQLVNSPEVQGNLASLKGAVPGLRRQGSVQPAVWRQGGSIAALRRLASSTGTRSLPTTTQALITEWDISLPYLYASVTS